MRWKSFFAYGLALSVVLTGCGTSAVTGDKEQETTKEKTDELETDTKEHSAGTETKEMAAFTAEEQFTERDLSGEYDEKEAERVTFSENGVETSGSATAEGNAVTISSDGVYILSGNCSDGMVIIDAEDSAKIQLVLKDLTLCSKTSAAIYVKQADKVFLTLADGTTNTLCSGSSYVAIDENNIDAVVYSKDDLTVNGTGTLRVESPSGHGIVGKDDLVFADGTYEISAEKDGISGKDSVRIAGGDFTIQAGDDGIKSESDDNTGYVYVCGGSFRMQTSDKGVEAGSTIYVADGGFDLNSEDDAFHSSGTIYIGAGRYKIDTVDDAFHADNTLTIAEGIVEVNSCYEGLEAQVIEVSGGEIDLVAKDDGLNAAGGKDGSQAEGGFGRGDMFDTDEDANINISGGILRVSAEGDGVDSNGYITVSGGEVYVTGPTKGGNASLDYGINAVIQGGIFVAAGASGMDENFGTESTQGCILVNTGNQQAESTITLTDEEGKDLIDWTSDKAYDCVWVSTPEIKEGSTYTLKAGDYSQEIAMDTLLYGTGSGMGFGGGRGGHGNMNPENFDRNQMKNGETPPEMPNREGMENGETSPEMPNREGMENGETSPEMPNRDQNQKEPDNQTGNAV